MKNRISDLFSASRSKRHSHETRWRERTETHLEICQAWRQEINQNPQQHGDQNIVLFLQERSHIRQQLIALYWRLSNQDRPLYQALYVRLEQEHRRLRTVAKAHFLGSEPRVDLNTSHPWLTDLFGPLPKNEWGQWALAADLAIHRHVNAPLLSISDLLEQNPMPNPREAHHRLKTYLQEHLPIYRAIQEAHHYENPTSANQLLQFRTRQFTSEMHHTSELQAWIEKREPISLLALKMGNPPCDQHLLSMIDLYQSTFITEQIEVQTPEIKDPWLKNLKITLENYLIRQRQDLYSAISAPEDALPHQQISTFRQLIRWDQRLHHDRQLFDNCCQRGQFTSALEALEHYIAMQIHRAEIHDQWPDTLKKGEHYRFLLRRTSRVFESMTDDEEKAEEPRENRQITKTALLRELLTHELNHYQQQTSPTAKILREILRGILDNDLPPLENLENKLLRARVQKMAVRLRTGVTERRERRRHRLETASHQRSQTRTPSAELNTQLLATVRPENTTSTEKLTAIPNSEETTEPLEPYQPPTYRQQSNPGLDLL